MHIVMEINKGNKSLNGLLLIQYVIDYALCKTVHISLACVDSGCLDLSAFPSVLDFYHDFHDHMIIVFVCI